MNPNDEALALILTFNRALMGLLSEAAAYLPKGDCHPNAADLRSRIDFALWLQIPQTTRLVRQTPIAADAMRLLRRQAVREE